MDSTDSFSGSGGLRRKEEVPFAAPRASRDGRYTPILLLGSGGGGDVYRAYDQVLQREVALKILRQTARQDSEEFQRFLSEAKICARLNHPAIVSIFDWGTTISGRPFLVMPIVRGKTLTDEIQESHPLTPARIHRLAGMVLAASEAIAYAHSQGVLHRDLKPGNIMVGSFGEVIVLDWGLACFRSTRASTSSAPSEPALLHSATQTGAIKGTVAYMAPEQARGETDQIDERADIFALGAVLYEVLTGRRLWGDKTKTAYQNACIGQVPALPEDQGLPASLVSIYQRATQRSPEDRFPSASELATALRSWLERQDDYRRARQLMVEAETALEDARRMWVRAEEHEARASEILAGLSPEANEELKLPGWREQDHAIWLKNEARLRETQRVQLLHSALTCVSDLPEAHHQLAALYYEQHRQAESLGDHAAAERYEYLLRAHARGRYQAYLSGSGSFSLSTSRPARVCLHRYRRHHRRLRLEPLPGELRTPIEGHLLPIGSYVAEITPESGGAVRYPFSVLRGGETNLGERSSQSSVVWLPMQRQCPPDMVYVPGGHFWSGSNESIFGAPLPSRRLWVDGFFISRFPITNEEYIVFLDDLVDQGMEREALLCAPRERTSGQNSGQVYGRDEQGHFILIPDADGDTWEPRWPVFLVPFAAMCAYAEWRSFRENRAYRLPYELEWEKAARGSGDQRPHPWGQHHDPNWCRGALSNGVGRSHPASVDTYPIDESPYGVRGMAGNVTDICLDHYHQDGPIVEGDRWRPRPRPTGLRTVRGGHWNAHAAKANLCWRGGTEEKHLSAFNGFRLVLPVPSGGLPEPERL